MNSIDLQNICERLDSLERVTTPELSWLIAVPVALVLNITVLPYVEHNDVPYLTKTTNWLLEREQELAVDLGIYVADKASGEKRQLPSQRDRYTLIGLTSSQTQALMSNISDSESGGKYTITNQFYYVGRWQFGASALAQVGLINKSKLKAASKCVRNGRCQKAFMRNSKNWNNGLSFKRFRYSQQLQNAAFIKLTNFNIASGFKKRVLSRTSSPSRVAGFAKASHLKGVNAAVRWYKYGKDSKDGNGTKISAYARSAERAVRNIK